MKIRLASNIQSDSIVDGEGMRSVIWFQGCLHNCKGCHNPITHDLNGGFETDTEEVKKEILALEDQDGITFSGGDPFFQPEAFLDLVKFIKEKTKLNIWAYTGYKYEMLIKKDPIFKEILNYVDVLVDGRFELDKKTLNSKFRGSSNQRIINVKDSILAGKVVLRYE